ncbi:MAG TPA: hypothetical protein VKK61_11485, partial [Tepidisphaeraceae bacterium]|nr:hypothetical protein [Tepidisphaeraceae bacterium]
MRRVILFNLVLTIALSSNYALAQQRHPTGLKPATRDQLRGVPLASTPYSGMELPKSADLSKDMPPPGQQGQEESCVGWATAYAVKSFEEKIEEKWSYFDQDGQLVLDDVFSPSFIYNQINNGRDGGCSYIDALNLLSDAGSATLNDMPYHDGDISSKPSDDAMQHAKRYRIDT